MPELPEVETIVRGLRTKVEGRTIVSFKDRDSKVVQILSSDVLGRKIIKIWRRAKNIIFDLNDGSAIIFHLKMTGQLIWEKDAGHSDFLLRNRKGGGHPDKAWLEKLPNKHTRAIFKFDDGSVLYFNDVRRFGYVKRISTQELMNGRTQELLKIGVEPLGEGLTIEYLEKMVKRYPNRKIKQFLLDQSIIAGIGNIYADESLFQAGIKPTRLAKDSNKLEWQKLIISVKQVLEQGIKYGGSSSENFVDAFGQQGRAHEYLKVYRKTGQPCPNNCGGSIKRIVLGGRGTHFCPKCQK